MKQPHPLLHSIQILPCPKVMLHKTCSGDRGKWPRLAGLQSHEDSAREGLPLLSPHRSLRFHPSERVTQRESVCFSDQFSFLKYLSVQVSVNIWNRLESNVLRESGQGTLGAVWSEGGLELGAGEMLRKPACGAVAGFVDCAVGVRRSLGSQSRVTGRVTRYLRRWQPWWSLEAAEDFHGTL